MIVYVLMGEIIKEKKQRMIRWIDYTSFCVELGSDSNNMSVRKGQYYTESLFQDKHRYKLSKLPRNNFLALVGQSYVSNVMYTIVSLTTECWLNPKVNRSFVLDDAHKVVTYTQGFGSVIRYVCTVGTAFLFVPYFSFFLPSFFGFLFPGSCCCYSWASIS